MTYRDEYHPQIKKDLKKIQSESAESYYNGAYSGNSLKSGKRRAACRRSGWQVAQKENKNLTR